MLTRRRIIFRRFMVGSVFWATTAVLGQLQLAGEKSSATQQDPLSGHRVVVLLDINPHQKEVLPVELALADGIIQRLDLPQDTFSVITFGSQTPIVLKSHATAGEAIAVLQGVALEKIKDKYFSVHFYEALNLAIGQFIDDTRLQSLIIISEGNDYFPRKTFKETVARAQRLQSACDVIMVADHTFYGTKGIQRYGFDLRKLASKTHGQYIEVGSGSRKVPLSVERLSKAILSRRSSSSHQ